MKYILTSIVIVLLQFKTSGQSLDHSFDSLRSVYHGTALFQKFQQYKKKPGLINGLQNELESIPNDTIRQIAGIAIFRNLYGYKWVEDKKMIKWINSITHNALSENIKGLALDIKTYLVDGIVGQQLVTINLPDHRGDSISTEKFEGKYLVIDLWATWCGPCIQEMKRIPGIRKKYGNLEFYSISFDNEYQKMQNFVRKKEYDWPVVFAGKDHPLWEYFRVGALPNYFIIDPKGKILVNTIHEIDAMIEKHVYTR